ncbi:30S ribosomal protein S24e [Candidatus Woesearchaeota archaeon]|nr:30S ribosomal protein S24e [Candidatus Woesearchaeota archaeon]
MELNIAHKKENPLLNRTEITAEVVYDAVTPNYNELTDSLASKLNKPKELIVIKKVKTFFGEKNADVSAYLYYDAESLAKIEPKKKEKKEKK